MTEVETILNRIQHNKGVHGVIVLDHINNIVKSTLESDVTEKYQKLFPELSYLARHMIRDLDPQNDLEFYRIRSKEQEIMIAAYSTFHLIVVQDPTIAMQG